MADPSGGDGGEPAESIDEAFLDQLQSFVGRTGTPQVARDPVNGATIRNWCDAMSDANPSFTDPVAAAASAHGGIVAPPSMLNAWNMRGLVMGRQPGRDLDEPGPIVHTLLDQAGFTSVVATNSDQVYDRYLRPGDLLTQQTVIAAVSAQKQTALGVGHFVTTETVYTDQAGEKVGSLFFRVFKFRPGTGRTKPIDPKRQALLDVGLDPDELLPVPERPPRPMPVYNQDQAWFWEGLAAHELRIQRFTDDGTLMHPPGNANPRTGSLAYDWVVAAGTGRLFSHTVAHYPEVRAFDYPLVIGLVELDEGVRVVSNVIGVAPEQLEIGMGLQVEFVTSADGVTLHQFRPADTPARAEPLEPADVTAGDQLPLQVIPITTRLIVSGALASRDFQDVHHDRDAARAKGTPDIFMNILTSSGLSTAWLGAWAGPAAVVRRLDIGLGVPNHPGDLMTFSGSVTEVEGSVVSVSFTGVNGNGRHITGSAQVDLAGPVPVGSG